jgi:membrane-bound metal-dependent hydrolase YbcI (DUF457 family)
MPSPLGHALAGVAIAWSAEAIRRQPLRVEPRFTLAGTCVALAISPDLDFLYPPIHRMMTHSLAAGLCVAVAMWVLHRHRRRDAWTIAVVCVAAFGSHLLLDWLGGDTKRPAGIQLLWPFSADWFISDLHVFRATDIGGFFKPRIMLSNAQAILQEVGIVLPFAAAAYAWRRRVLGAGTGGPKRWPAAGRLAEDGRP